MKKDNKLNKALLFKSRQHNNNQSNDVIYVYYYNCYNAEIFAIYSKIFNQCL